MHPEAVCYQWPGQKLSLRRAVSVLCSLHMLSRSALASVAGTRLRTRRRTNASAHAGKKPLRCRGFQASSSVVLAHVLEHIMHTFLWNLCASSRVRCCALLLSPAYVGVEWPICLRHLRWDVGQAISTRHNTAIAASKILQVLQACSGLETVR